MGEGTGAGTIAGCVLGAAALGTAAVVGAKALMKKKSDTTSTSSETASSDNVFQQDREIEPVKSSWWSNWYLIPIVLGILILLAGASYLFFPTVSEDEQNEVEDVHPAEDRV